MLVFNLFVFITYPLSKVFFPGNWSLQMFFHYTKLNMLFLSNNYRPVSLLSILSKVFEKRMYSRVTECLEAYRVIINLDSEKSLFIYGTYGTSELINQICRERRNCSRCVSRLWYSCVDHHIYVNWNIMELEIMLWIGFEAILLIINNM